MSLGISKDQMESAGTTLRIRRETEEHNLNTIAKEIHRNTIEHGFCDKIRTFGDIIALCHSELSEAFEEYRSGYQPTYTYHTCHGEYCECEEGGKPEGIPIELADCIIRILDFCAQENIDIEEAIRSKMNYNKGRSYKHGGKII